MRDTLTLLLIQRAKDFDDALSFKKIRKWKL
jgi:hypothetical protein